MPLAVAPAAKTAQLVARVGEQYVDVGRVRCGALKQLALAGAAGMAWDRGEEGLAAVAYLDQLGGGQLAEVGVDLGYVDCELLES